MHYPHSFYGVRQRWAFDEAKVSRARVLYTQHMRRGLPPPIFFVKCSNQTFMLERAECVAVGCRSAVSCSLPASLPPTSPILGIYCTTLTLHRPRTLTWWRDNDSHCLFFFLCPSPLQPFQPTSNKYCFFFSIQSATEGIYQTLLLHRKTVFADPPYYLTTWYTTTRSVH